MKDSIEIRSATPADSLAVAYLAELDSRPAPVGEALLARVDGILRAAVGADGRVVADPFHPTADLVRLLQLRVSQQRATQRPANGLLSRIAPVWRAEARQT